MMIHAIIHNPTEVTMDLWPFAMEYALFASGANFVSLSQE